MDALGLRELEVHAAHDIGPFTVIDIAQLDDTALALGVMAVHELDGLLAELSTADHPFYIGIELFFELIHADDRILDAGAGSGAGDIGGLKG